MNRVSIEIRQHWSLVKKTLLIMAVIVAVFDQFLPWFYPDLSAFLLIAASVMHISSEKIEGRIISLREKAFGYFGIYLISFFIFARHLVFKAQVDIYVFLIVALSIVVLILYQTIYFKNHARNSRDLVGVICIGLLAMVLLCFVGLYLIFIVRKF